MKILFVSPETVPFAASGGLADVAEALPVALQQMEAEVYRVMPKYKGIEEKFELKKLFSFIVETGGEAKVADIYSSDFDGVMTFFIGNTYYFERDGFYGYGDDDERFGFFSKATLEMLMFMNLQPDIIHLNDWQTALIGLLLKQEYMHLSFYNNIKLIFTIHNLQYQGVFEKSVLEDLNLPIKYFNMEAIEYYGKVCYMKAGIVYADLVTTVSKSYAKEIQTPWYGYGLDGLLRKYSQKIYGIVNGIYYDKYDPSKDSALEFPFHSENYDTVRPLQKASFQKELGLPVKDVPLFGVVTRLAEQKGVDLIIYAIEQLIREDIQVVILGSGDYFYENRLLNLQEQYPDKISVNIQFNQGLARRIYGSIDMFLMPSLFEPCGLSQLYSLRYGAVPVVRRTGGLGDTIIDFDEHHEISTGFIFKNYNNQEFVRSIKRGIEIFYQKDEWKALVKRGMVTRFSWDKSAEEYMEQYQLVVGNSK
ncbi:MAG: glycogen synthase [Vallitaleaceae bacterium]|nr:glycogen synthase [Vallitaleaceae bacterium]